MVLSDDSASRAGESTILWYVAGGRAHKLADTCVKATPHFGYVVLFAERRQRDISEVNMLVIENVFHVGVVVAVTYYVIGPCLIMR
jgi:hypothetical protein